MSLIPQIAGAGLTGNKKFNIQRTIELAFGSQKVDFGALFEVPLEIGGKTFALYGWIGPAGKTEHVVAEYTETPEKARGGESEKPSLRIYAEVEGALTEIAVAFRHEAAETKKIFHSGKTTGSPAISLTFWAHVPKEANEEVPV